MPHHHTTSPTRLRRLCVLLTLVTALAGLSAQPTQAATRLVASETFSSAMTKGWGSADLGGYWATSSPDLSVAGGRGVVSLTAGDLASARLSEVKSLDTRVAARVAVGWIPARGDGIVASLSVRDTGADAYSARIDYPPGGQPWLSAIRRTAAGSTVMRRVALPFTVTGDGAMDVTLEVSGTGPVSVRAKAWPLGSAEPSAWTLDVTDSSADRLVTAGSVGMQAGLASTTSEAYVYFDGFQAWDLGGVAGSAPAPPPPPVTADPGAPGSLPVGGAVYASPANSLHVATWGTSGGDGTSASPIRTLQGAVDRAGSGGTIVVHEGSYTEDVTVPSGKTLTIQNAPGEAVWLDGSTPVTGFQQIGSTWVRYGWTNQHDASYSLTKGQSFPGFVRPDYPMAAYADQVFVGGVELRQVATAAQVSPGTFAVDTAADKLVIGTNPSTGEVRASVLERALTVVGDGTVIRGIGVRRYANPGYRLGAIFVAAARASVENVVVQDNATTGLTVIKDSVTLRRITARGNGLIGIHANSSYGLTVDSVLVTDNNDEHFGGAPCAGGIKVTRARGVRIANGQFSRNDGNGIWLDESVHDAVIAGNESSANASSGVQVEISEFATIAGNVLTGNAIGLNIYSSGRIRAFNNDLSGTSGMAVRVYADARRQWLPVDTGTDPRRPVPDPTVTWVVRSIELKNNIMTNSGTHQLFVHDLSGQLSADEMDVRVNGNVFASTPMWGKPQLGIWVGRNDAYEFIHTVTQLQQRVAGATANVGAPQGLSVDQFRSWAQAQSNGVGVPSDIAPLPGVPATPGKVGPTP